MSWGVTAHFGPKLSATRTPEALTEWVPASIAVEFRYAVGIMRELLEARAEGLESELRPSNERMIRALERVGGLVICVFSLSEEPDLLRAEDGRRVRCHFPLSEDRTAAARGET